MKRSGKFYYNNEKKVLKSLGLIPAPGSGSGWIIKEDGENETIMVQLKSTDASSYRLDMLDMKKLEYHAAVSHKHPLFLVQFLQHDRIYAIVDLDSLSDIAAGISTRERPKERIEIVEQPLKNDRLIKTSKKSRTKFFEERSEKFAKRK